jgi:hypothetical protein
VTPAGEVDCRFRAKAIGGSFGGLVEVAADHELLEQIAFSRAVVQVQLWGLRFRCTVAGFRKDLRVLHVRAGSFFRGLAEALEREQLVTNDPR